MYKRNQDETSFSMFQSVLFRVYLEFFDVREHSAKIIFSENSSEDPSEL